MQSRESEIESESENSSHLILPRNSYVIRYKLIALVCIIGLLIGKFTFLFLQSSDIFGNSQEILQLIDFIFALFNGFVIYLFLYIYDHPEILASLLHNQEFLREQEKPILVECRFLYAGMGVSLFYLGWSFGNTMLNLTLVSVIVGFLSGIIVIYLIRQISNRMSKELNLPPIQKVNSPQNRINQIFGMILLLGLLGTLYTSLLLLGIYLYFQTQGYLKPDAFSRSMSDSSDFSSTIDYQTFWKQQFLNGLVINVACLLFLLLPPWFLGTISWQYSSLGIIFLLLIPLLIFQIGGYIAVIRRMRFFGLPIRRLILLFSSWIYLIIASILLQSSLSDLLLLSRFKQMEFILLNEMFLGVFLLVSPVLQIHSFAKSAATQLTFRSRKEYTRMFILYGLSQLGVEVVLVLLALIGFALQLFARFGIGTVGALLLVNIFLIPALGKQLREQYRQGIKKYT
ncbi:MAG: hypothetical protein ACTSYI_09715 [Promethearchaeota archaeon]